MMILSIRKEVPRLKYCATLYMGQSICIFEYLDGGRLSWNQSPVNTEEQVCGSHVHRHHTAGCLHLHTHPPVALSSPLALILPVFCAIFRSILQVSKLRPREGK